MTKNKYEELLSKAPEESMKIFRDAGLFDSIQCHGYAICGRDNNNKDREDDLKTDKEDDLKGDKKWWQFWKRLK